MTDQESRKVQLRELLLGKTVHVTLSDDRVIKGRLDCFDGGKNVILSESCQLSKDNSTTQLGYVMLPGHHIKEMELEN